MVAIAVLRAAGACGLDELADGVPVIGIADGAEVAVAQVRRHVPGSLVIDMFGHGPREDAPFSDPDEPDEENWRDLQDRFLVVVAVLREYGQQARAARRSGSCVFFVPGSVARPGSGDLADTAFGLGICGLSAHLAVEWSSLRQRSNVIIRPPGGHCPVTVARSLLDPEWGPVTGAVIHAGQMADGRVI